MIDDQDRCEWVNVCFDTGSPGLSRTKVRETVVISVCVCVCVCVWLWIQASLWWSPLESPWECSVVVSCLPASSSTWNGRLTTQLAFIHSYSLNFMTLHDTRLSVLYFISFYTCEWLVSYGFHCLRLLSRCMLRFVTINVCATFEVPIFTRYGNRKGNAKCIKYEKKYIKRLALERPNLDIRGLVKKFWA